MARQYNISHIESYETDSSGYIRVEFRVRGDLKETLRLIEGNNYVDWVESLDSNRGYISENWTSDLYDDDYSNSSSRSGFDFEEWKDENEDEGIIKKFIYENFSLNELPDPE